MKITDKINLEKIAYISDEAAEAYLHASADTNISKMYPNKIKGFNEKILKAAKEANHIILFSGMDGDGDIAYLKRFDGSALGVINADDYVVNPIDYKTKNPDCYIYATTRGGLEKNDGTLS